MTRDEMLVLYRALQDKLQRIQLDDASRAEVIAVLDELAIDLLDDGEYPE